MEDLTGKYNIWDGRGPILINMVRRMEHVSDGQLTGVRSLVYVGSKDTMEGTLIKPTSQYVHKWLPGNVKYNKRMKIVTGARHWGTSHSVTHIILTLIVKEQQGWRHTELIKGIKVEVDERVEEL